MKHNEFAIGETFYCGGGLWRCTDIGTRVITAIRLDHVDTTSVIAGSERQTTLNQTEAEAAGWFNGPPYAVAEWVFDETDLPACSKDNHE